MKKRNFLLNLLLCFSLISSSQTKDTARINVSYLLIMSFDGDQPPVVTKNILIDQAVIKERHFLNDNALCSMFKVQQIAFIKLKTGTKLLTLNNVFDLYHVKKMYRKCPVKVGDYYVDQPEGMFFSKNRIANLTIKKNRTGHYIQIEDASYIKMLKQNKKNKEDGLIRAD